MKVLQTLWCFHDTSSIGKAAKTTSSVAHCLVKKLGFKCAIRETGGELAYSGDYIFFQGCNDKAVRKTTWHLFGDSSIQVVLTSSTPSFQHGEQAVPVKAWRGTADKSEARTLCDMTEKIILSPRVSKDEGR